MGIIPSIKISFYITGDNYDLEEATKRIGIVPTMARTKGSLPPNALAYTIWAINIKEENCIAVSILFERMLSILDGKANIINELCNDYSLATGFEVVIHMKDGDSPEVVLPREVISFAAAINAEIGFDIYCYE